MKAYGSVLAIAVLSLLGSDRAVAATSGGRDPLAVAFFSLSIDGTDMFFGELVALTSQVEPDSHKREGGHRDADAPQGSLVLRRGFTNDATLSAWHELAASGNIAGAKKNVKLSLYLADLTVVGAYLLQGAWPSKLEVGSIAGATMAVVETVTLTCDWITRVAN